MKILKSLFIIAFVVTILVPFSHAEDQKVRWKLAMTWGPTLHPFVDTVESMANMVETMSGGNFVIRIDASNKHKSPFGVFDMVKLGQYDMAHTASYYWKGKDVAFLPLTTMPFGMTTPEQYAWFYEGGGMALMQEVYGQHGMLSYPGGNTGNQMGGWFRKEINSLEDLKGLKMRIPGFAGQVLANLGVTVTNIPPGELYTSLERGTIDALEWVGPGMDIKMGFHKIAPYYYTGWHEPATELQFLVNQKAYDKLPEKYKEILKVAMKTASYDMYIENYHMSSEAWSSIKEDYPNIKIKTFPEEVISAMVDSNDALVVQYKNENPMFKKIIESQEAYMKKSREWTYISDYLYLKSISDAKK
ncbi:MAG: TRAP transporter substrate-binding protein [Deltaproteobacteria bacterium]|jgi:TRAP-type mannitol/chloroaromatic compound transport system substrate-binding protein|nr:TRAP transporter substrate-binding protein [Deltaproteobacteria bacterium]